MLELHAGQSGEKVIVTLTELQTLDDPYFLFRFTHTLTKQVVSFIKSNAADESAYPERSNQFDVNTGVVFLNKPVGEWLYEIYEQASSSNTNPDNATTLLEQGKMRLYPATAFEFDSYNSTPSYKTYNG